MRDLGRRVIRKVSAAIEQSVESFLHGALQMQPEQVQIQLEAEALGYL